MPRTLPAELEEVMDAGVYDPYLRVVVGLAPDNVDANTIEPIGFKLEALTAEVRLPFTPGVSEDTDKLAYFRIVRGAIINGVPSTISTIWFTTVEFFYNGEYHILKGQALDNTYQVTDPDLTYEEVIEFVIGQSSEIFGYSYEGAATWKNYQFYPDGKNVVINKAMKLFTLLKQKYLIFATEDGWDGVTSNLFFFCGPQPRATDYEFTDILFKTNARSEDRRLIFRDENNSVHSQGSGTLPIYNLGFLPSTAAFPDSNPINTLLGSKSSKLQVHLERRTGDWAECEGDGIGPNGLNARINVIEVLDLNSNPAWYQIIETLAWFDGTEGGPLPSTIEAAAPYTPLATGNFDRFLTTAVNNLQAFADWVNDFAMSAALLISGGTIREKLTAARTYYVRTDGSDSNTGLANTAGGAFLTVQKAIDVIAGTLDISIYDVTIQVADGTYSGNIVPKSCVGTGAVIIQGNAGTPGNVVLTCSSGVLIIATNIKTTYKLRDFKMTGTGTASVAVSAINGSYLEYQNVEFGSGFVNFHVSIADLGSINVTGNYSISGGCGTHWVVQVGALRCQSRTITLTGTPAFTQFALAARSGSTMIVNSNTFSGSATGKRYDVSLNATIFASGTETYLPGNALGSQTSGGRYDTFDGRSRVSTQFDKTNTTLANITGLTATLPAGRTCRGRLILYTTSNIGGGVNVDFDGGTATATAFIAEAMLLQAGALVAPGTSRSTALATDLANVTAVTVATIIIEFVITVNAAGTLIPRFACNTAVGTSSVLVGSNMIIEDITP